MSLASARSVFWVDSPNLLHILVFKSNWHVGWNSIWKGGLSWKDNDSECRPRYPDVTKSNNSKSYAPVTANHPHRVKKRIRRIWMRRGGKEQLQARRIRRGKSKNCILHPVSFGTNLFSSCIRIPCSHAARRKGVGELAASHQPRKQPRPQLIGHRQRPAP